MANAFKKSAATTNAYYTITFDPNRTAQVDEYHEIKLEVANRNLSVHTFSGYYDEPIFYDQPSSPKERLGVAQLESRFAVLHPGEDRRTAKELETAELTERFSSARFEALSPRLPGLESREALRALADRSAFLPPPDDEVLPYPEPDTGTRDEMLDRTTLYVKQTLSQLPNLFATRTTARFNETGKQAGWKGLPADETLHLTETTKTTVLIRNGKEIVDRAHRIRTGEHNLLTEGTFGPILNIVLSSADGAHRQLKWSHWERGRVAPVAVFRYSASNRSAGLHVDSCCTAEEEESTPLESADGFHGEIAIDPASGAILRLTVEIDLKPGMLINRSAVTVEYEPITIGGVRYICPAHSVGIARQRIGWALHEWGQGFVVYGHYETLLNDVTFSQYHLFRAESTILPGFATTNDKP